MANELNYYGNLSQTGLTVIARVYDATGTQVGLDISCTEDTGSLAIYSGDMPTAPLGVYGVRFFDGSTLLGQGSINWSGLKETDLIITDNGLLNKVIYFNPSASVNGDGTNSNPFNNLADVITKSDNEGIETIKVTSGNFFTLSQSCIGKKFKGTGYAINLGNQDITDSEFENAYISGVGTATLNRFVTFRDCVLGRTLTSANITTIPAGIFYNCSIVTVNISSVGFYEFIDCYSGRGTSLPLINFLSVSGITVSLRRYSGNMFARNLVAGSVIVLDSTSGDVFRITGTGGTAILTGMIGRVDDFSGGNVGIGSNSLVNKVDLALETTQVEMKENQITLNEGIKNSSLLIPYTDNLPNI